MTGVPSILLSPPAGRVDATVALPGSKSYTNRALVIAALAEGTSVIRGSSPSSDSASTMEGLRKLGIEIEEEADAIVVHGRGGQLHPYEGIIDVGPAGTAMRFLTALCSAAEGSVITLQGTERMHRRPIGELVDALRVLGASIEYLGDQGCPPLRIRGRKLDAASRTTLAGGTSSQFFTALLLIAPCVPHGLRIEVRGDQVSKSYIDMTIESMRSFGAAVRNESYAAYEVQKGVRYHASEYQVEGDASAASYLWGIAALANGRVTVENINPASAQGDVKFAELLVKMGCRVESSGTRAVTVTGAAALNAITIDMSSMPDTAQSLAVVASVARGTTVMTGLQTLRVKETDRIAALHNELQKIGIHTSCTADTLSVTGGSPHGASIATYEDHRMAMSFAMLGARIPGVSIEHPEVVAKSFPDFWNVLEHLGIKVTT